MFWFRILLRVTFLLIFVSFSHAAPNHIITVGSCVKYGNDVVRMLNVLKAPTIGWHFVVTCNETDWITIKQRYDIVHTDTAFTSVDIGYTFLNGHLVSSSDFLELRRVLNHELAHIRCLCALGEQLHY